MTVKFETKYLFTNQTFLISLITLKSGDENNINTWHQERHCLSLTRNQLYRLYHCRLAALPHLQDGVVIFEKAYALMQCNLCSVYYDMFLYDGTWCQLHHEGSCIQYQQLRWFSLWYLSGYIQYLRHSFYRQ